MQDTFHKVFNSGEVEDGNMSAEELRKRVQEGGGTSYGGDSAQKPTLNDTGTVATKMGSAEKQIVSTFQDFEKAVKGGTVNDLEAMKSNMQNIIAKVTEESPSLTKQLGRVFSTAYKGMNKVIEAVAKDSGIEDWTQTSEDYGKFTDAKKVIDGTTDAQGKIDYAQISKNVQNPAWKSTIDFLQSKTGIPVRAYSEFANWSEQVYKDSKVSDIIKTVAGKAAGLPMMGMGRQLVNLIGDTAGKTFSEIDKALDGAASELESGIKNSSSLMSTLKKMGLSTKQGVMMLLSGLSNPSTVKGAIKVGAGQTINPK
jgi:hypothetical protein